MSKIVTPEMVSAFVDGELSPEDNLLVENALLADSALRDIAEGYQMLRSSLHSSSEYVTSTVQLPQQFTSSIMEKIQRLPGAVGPDDHHSKSGSPVVDRVQLADQASDFSVANSKRLTTMSSVYSIRTLVEVLVATVAVVLIVLNWPTPISESGGAGQSVVNNGVISNDPVSDRKQSDVQMLSVGDGKTVRGGSKNGGGGNPISPSKTKASKTKTDVSDQSSREFSIFVDESVRPKIDRFWIMKSYEVSSPQQEPDGRVNMLLIDAKKTDAVKFFGDLEKWDPDFKCYQDSGKRTNASWLAPFDVSKISEAEGDFWKLRIVLISK